ncbi:MAG TPA: metallophosphoesterase [Opitutales bacterium]|nr:metallophosphoesterase [Opitutales bacterium]
MNLCRRNFLGGVIALGVTGGCKTLSPGFDPDLKLGVISDVHIMTPETCALMEKSFRYFRCRGVDAVVISGDLSDWGLKSGFQYIKATWDRVFEGTDVVPLLCTGNHDFEGWWYGDMTVEMHALGYDEGENLEKLGMKKCWEEVFGEEWAPVRCRTVKGFDFVSCESRSEKELAGWMEKNGGKLCGPKPFFYFQHVPVRDCKQVWNVLEHYPNCVAFTGHVHVPFNDERSIRQGSFTEISVPSLSYAGSPSGHENGSASRRGDATMVMPMLPDRFNLRGGQGYVVSVYGDEMVVERRDLEEDAEGAEAWVVPLPGGKEKPYDLALREKTLGVPEFPAGAQIEIGTRNTVTRQGKWCAAMNCVFPSATIADNTRVWDYEIRAVPKDGSEPMVKRFLSPAYAKMAKFEPARQKFWFDVVDLPQDKEYVVEVYARNCFGKHSKPLVSGVRRGKPGLATCRKN